MDPVLNESTQRRHHSQAFYLDDKHNIVPEDKATIRVIQVLDENGNMIEEIWQKRATPEVKPPEDDTTCLTRYVDDQGREVDQSVATHIIFDTYSKGRLVSSDKYLLSQAAEIRKLDIHGKLELKHQPGKKEREQELVVEGHRVKLTLPSYVSTTAKEYVVKNAGRTDYTTGKTGDAYIMVNCKSIFFRWNTLGRILLNLLLVLVCLVYSVFLLLKWLVTSKWFLLILSAAAMILGCWYFDLL